MTPFNLKGPISKCSHILRYRVFRIWVWGAGDMIQPMIGDHVGLKNHVANDLHFAARLFMYTDTSGLVL